MKKRQAGQAITSAGGIWRAVCGVGCPLQYLRVRAFASASENLNVQIQSGESQGERRPFSYRGRVPSGFWNKKENLMGAIDRAEQKLGIQKVLMLFN